MNNIQRYTDDADIKIRPGITSVSKAVVERIKAASWDEINTVDDMGFQMIARAVKERQARDEQEDDYGYKDGDD